MYQVSKTVVALLLLALHVSQSFLPLEGGKRLNQSLARLDGERKGDIFQMTFFLSTADDQTTTVIVIRAGLIVSAHPG